MSEVSFEVKQDALAIVQSTVIEANFDEVKAALKEMVQPYATMIVAEDGIANAKADRAKIRKVAARVEEVRKMVKKTYSEPLQAFEAKCKELVAVCDTGSENLDRQIKEFEQREADAKIENLRAEYDAMTTPELSEYLPWGYVNNPKWANKGYAYDTAVAEIKAALESAQRDIDTIRSMGGDDTAYLLDIYRQTRDLSAVVRKASDLKTMREREEQRRRAEDERRQQAELARREGEKPADPAPEYAPAVTTVIEQDELVTVTFKVVCTRTQLNALGKYMKQTGIKYGRASD